MYHNQNHVYNIPIGHTVYVKNTHLSRRPLQRPPEAERRPPRESLFSPVDCVEVLGGLHVCEAAREEDDEGDGGRDAAEEGGASAGTDLKKLYERVF